MDYLKIEPAMMIGMAAVIIALSVGYYLGAALLERP
jgi:type II secretory pathway component PulF